MARKMLAGIGVVVVLAVGYLLFWPVPIDPVAWEPPPDPRGTGPFARNERLAGMEVLSLGDNYGPEATTVGHDGRIYVATHDWIVRLEPNGSRPENWVQTGGRPLGMAFDADGNLIVADAPRGLLSISPAGEVTELATSADGVPIHFADDLDIAADGKIYFSDASTKHNPVTSGTFSASTLDIIEHGGHGRLIVYDPATRQAITLRAGLNFANGVAVAHDHRSVLFNETGHYRVLRIWIDGPNRGQVEPVIEALPGFPDNITRGLDGRYWVALFAPRSAILDRAAGSPFLRKVMLRLPDALRPSVRAYGHILAIDDSGRVVADLQDPSGTFPSTTSALETAGYIYVGSLVAPKLGRVEKSRAGLRASPGNPSNN